MNVYGISVYPSLRNKGNKFRAQKTVINGITFDSKKEAERYFDLCMLEKAGEIKDLKNAKIKAWVEEWVKWCEPDSVYICDGSKEEYERMEANRKNVLDFVDQSASAE